MNLQILYFYLDKNQSHGQNDKFLRVFLLKLGVCRPQEDLNFWQVQINFQKTKIILYHKGKNLKIIVLDKTDLSNGNLIKMQKEFVNDTIKKYQENLLTRERLIFINLTNDLDSESVMAYQLIENKKLIEFLQWRAIIEIKDWLESCLEILEDGNWFKKELNDYLRKLEF